MKLLDERGMTRYQLAKALGYTRPRIYDLFLKDGTFGRLDANVLNNVCEYFRLTPGELLEWIPGVPQPRRSDPRRSRAKGRVSRSQPVPTSARTPTSRPAPATPKPARPKPSRRQSRKR
jgi:DNA-binding Xre family transcriptional regulator